MFLPPPPHSPTTNAAIERTPLRECACLERIKVIHTRILSNSYTAYLGLTWAVGLGHTTLLIQSVHSLIDTYVMAYFDS